MTIIAHVKQAMLPLLRRHSDLALVGRMLVIKPVRHVLRFVCIDRRSSPHIFVVNTAVTLPFLNLKDWPLSGGRLLYIHQRMWDIRDLESIELLREMIEEALPELRQINSIEKYIAYRSNHPESSCYFLNNHHLQAIATFANGDLEQAISILEAGIESGRQDWIPPYYPALKARDRTALIAFLYEQRSFSMKALKLQKIWEPTPFPLELSASQAETSSK